jgi:hypothetical protein
VPSMLGRQGLTPRRRHIPSSGLPGLALDVLTPLALGPELRTQARVLLRRHPGTRLGIPSLLGLEVRDLEPVELEMLPAPVPKGPAWTHPKTSVLPARWQLAISRSHCKGFRTVPSEIRSDR